MLAIIGFIAIFAAIIVFFSEELTAYVQSLKAKPLLFLMLSLLLASTFVVSCNPCFLWVVVTIWVKLLKVIEWLINEIGISNGIVSVGLAKWLILLLVSLSPIISIWVLIQWKKPFEKIAAIWRHQGYEISIILGVITLILLGLQLPDVNSY